LGRCALEKQDEQKQKQYDIDILEKHITKDSISELAHTVIVRNGWEIVDAKEQKTAWSGKQGEKYMKHSYITTNPEFFQWIYDRLKYVYNENPNVDYMLSLKERIEDMQKFADKIEPKFKVGDWVVRKDGKPFFNGNHYAQITVIDKEQYWFDSGTWLETKDIRLWTIQDAKNGDILQSSNKPFIYNEYLEEGKYPFGYGGINLYGRFGVSNGLLPMTHDEVTPATKEQRDLLFQKMKEAGYEWDAETKELKSLISNGGDFDSKNCEQKSAWGEEDDWMKTKIIKVLLGCETFLTPEETNECIDWLKSIKDRYAWKPSDEQMEALFVLLPTVSYGKNPAFSLYNDLKKLKGE
jgi:hypothetical protein